MTKTIAILGSTGSIGTQALQLVRLHPDRFTVKALTAHSNIEEILVAATCTEKGKTAEVYCTVCEVIITESVNKKQPF